MRRKRDLENLVNKTLKKIGEQYNLDIFVVVLDYLRVYSKFETKYIIKNHIRRTDWCDAKKISDYSLKILTRWYGMKYK